jgi:CRP/FNR family transcriptional regulator, transcriptional activator FtrB
MKSIGDMLYAVPGFAQLESAVLERVAAVGDIAEVRSGAILFREGGAPESLYVLLEGYVSLTGSAAGASSTVIDIVGPASSFVLANVLANEPYLMGAEAVAPSVLIRLAAAPMRAVVATQPAAAVAMMRAMSAEVGSMTRQVVDLKVRVAAQRLGAYLLGLMSDPTATHASFRLPVNKGLLALWLGCRAENLSRAFVALRKYGVETHGSRVVLHETARLRTYAGASECSHPGDSAIPHGDTASGRQVEKVLD